MHYLFDTLMPIRYTPGVIAERSAVKSWTLAATLVGCGAWHAWRTRRVSAAMLIAVLSALVAGLLAQAGTLLCFAVCARPADGGGDPRQRGFDEAFIGPSIGLTALAFVMAIPSAVAGRVARAAYGWSSANTKSA